MKNYLILGVATVLAAACVSVVPYKPTTDSKARLRLVAQSAGNGQFAFTQSLQCPGRAGDGLKSGDSLLTVLSGAPIAVLSVRKPRLLGMPGADALREWTYEEFEVDSNKSLNFFGHYTTPNNALNPYDVSSCSASTPLVLEKGKDYELYFAGGRNGCRLQLVELTSGGTAVQRKPVDELLQLQDCRPKK